MPVGRDAWPDPNETMGRILPAAALRNVASGSAAPRTRWRGGAARTRRFATAGRAKSFGRRWLWLWAIAALIFGGCTSLGDWWRNGLKVGPNYCPPCPPATERWIDADNSAVRAVPAHYSYWWTVFNDPILDQLVLQAQKQNLSLKAAGLRILEARAMRGVATGKLYPQVQQMFAGYNRTKYSEHAYPYREFPLAQSRFDTWEFGLDAAWELDFWGRFRRGIEAADAELGARVEDYRDVLVILQAEVAANYVQMRVFEERLRLARKNVKLQRETLETIGHRLEEGVVCDLDVHQAESILTTTQSLIPTLEAGRREARNRLCVLLGVPPYDVPKPSKRRRSIPEAPSEIVVGIPADMLRRRPDVRRAEREAAAQCAQIGIAMADLYPQFTIAGTISLRAEDFGRLFDGNSLAGWAGPGFRWNVLNYGRISNNINAQDARFQQLVVQYRETVLEAYEEVENAIVAFLREKERVGLLEKSVQSTQQAAELAVYQYEEGIVDYQRVLDSQRALVLQQDSLAESRGQVARNLIAVYKAMGGGWQMCPTPDPTLVATGTKPVPKKNRRSKNRKSQRKPDAFRPPTDWPVPPPR
jgi:NodT family efflux transporter outer membrane factor (OMF) lipoprotein